MGAVGRENLRHTGLEMTKKQTRLFAASAHWRIGLFLFFHPLLCPAYPPSRHTLSALSSTLSAAPLRHSIIHSVLSNYPPGSLLLYYSVVKEWLLFFFKRQYR